MQLYYSIFKYKSIPLGVLFHEPTFVHRAFKYIPDLHKFEVLCTEIDVKIVEKLLVGIKEQVEAAKSFNIEDFIRFYLNDFHFEEMRCEEYGDLDGTIERIVKSSL